jgi:hypothetical protein
MMVEVVYPNASIAPNINFLPAKGKLKRGKPQIGTFFPKKSIFSLPSQPLGFHLFGT